MSGFFDVDPRAPRPTERENKILNEAAYIGEMHIWMRETGKGRREFKALPFEELQQWRAQKFKELEDRECAAFVADGGDAQAYHRAYSCSARPGERSALREWRRKKNVTTVGSLPADIDWSEADGEACEI